MSVRGALWTRLRAALIARGQAPALTFLDARGQARTWSGAEVLARAEALAARVPAALRDRREPVGVLLASQADQVEHFLGLLAAGARPALLTPPNRKLQLEHYQHTIAEASRRCRFGAIVSDGALPGAATTVLAPRSLAVAAAHAQPDAAAAIADDVSFLQFSSGTTGIKRGVRVSDAAVLAQLDTYAAALGLSERDVIVSWLPLYHDMGFVACLLMPLAHGVHTVMLQPLDWVARPLAYLKAVHGWRGTLSWHPNFAYAFMAERVTREQSAGLDLSSLRALVNCSEPVTHASQRRFAERFRENGLADGVFAGCYAMAETTFALTHGRSSDAGALDPRGPAGERHPATGMPCVSVGRALPGVTLEAVDEQGRILPERRVGELRVRAPFVMSGYHLDDASTRDALRGGAYHTGDLGYRVGEEWFVVGRRKDLLIVAGVNVWPQDLEQLACETPGVHPGRAAAFSAFDPALQTERIVLLAESDAPEAAHRAIETSIRQRVLAALQVAHVEVRVLPPGWLLKSSSGKMARSLNRERWLEQTAAR